MTGRGIPSVVKFLTSTLLLLVLSTFVLHVEQSLALGKKFEKGLLYGYLLAKVNSLTHQQHHPPM